MAQEKARREELTYAEWEDFIVIEWVDNAQRQTAADGRSGLESSTDSGYAEPSKGVSQVMHPSLCTFVLSAVRI